MKALLLSAYDAQSHRVWRTTLRAMFPEIDWTELTLPPRYFPWRVRGNSMTWAFNHRAQLTDNYDFLLCTSMTDLSALRGFVPSLGQIPTAVYFHENQFAYPENPSPAALRLNPIEPQMLSIYTALCADRLVFNSDYNRRSFIAGARRLLAKLPDHVPSDVITLLDRGSVIPVPLDDALFSRLPMAPAPDPSLLEIVWNHRWEYDKGPALLLAIVQEIRARGLRCRLHLLGQQFRETPRAFIEAQEILAAHATAMGMPAGQVGYVEDPSEYRQRLSAADVVMSTAEHDFQGLALLESMALGCTPLAPARLVYPEYLPQHCLYEGADLVQEALAAVDRLERWAVCKREGNPLPQVSAQAFSSHTLTPAYRALFEELCLTKSRPP